MPLRGDESKRASNPHFSVQPLFVGAPQLPIDSCNYPHKGCTQEGVRPPNSKGGKRRNTAEGGMKRGGNFPHPKELIYESFFLQIILMRRQGVPERPKRCVAIIN
jgi:hypothetical protein